MNKRAIAGEMVKLAKELTALQGSRVFLVEADQKLEALKDLCADNAADYAVLGSEGAEAVQAYRKVYTMVKRLQEQIPSVIRTAFDE